MKRYSFINADKSDALDVLNRMQNIMLALEPNQVRMNTYMNKDPKTNACGTAGCLLGWSITDPYLSEKLGLALKSSGFEMWPHFLSETSLIVTLPGPWDVLRREDGHISSFLFSSAGANQVDKYGTDKNVAVARCEFMKYKIEKGTLENTHLLGEEFTANGVVETIKARLANRVPKKIRIDFGTE